jgi:two-component system, cell cycle response regulator CtrA
MPTSIGPNYENRAIFSDAPRQTNHDAPTAETTSPHISGGYSLMRILLIEDDAVMATLETEVLRENSFIVDSTELGEDGVSIGKRYDYDIIILDLALPDIDGYEVLRRLRAAHVRTPVIIVSGRTGIDSKIKALNLGADDFITKPFNEDELIARIRAVIRRATGHSHSMIRTGKIVLDLDGRTAAVDNQRLHLTNKEYGVLEALSLRKGIPHTKEMLLNHLYGVMDEPELKIVDVFVCHLRKKLAVATGGDHYIETVWGGGYVMRDPIPDQIEPGLDPYPKRSAVRQAA